MSHTVKASGKERQAMLFWTALCDSLADDGKTLENRLRFCSPTAWRDWRLCQTKMEKIWDQLCATLEQPDRVWMNRALNNNEVTIKQRGPVRAPDYVVMDAQYANALIVHAMRNECQMCTREDGHVRKCELRKAIEWIHPLPNGSRKPDGFCEYSYIRWGNVDVEQPIERPEKKE